MQATIPRSEAVDASPPTVGAFEVAAHTVTRVAASTWIWVWVWLVLIAFGWALSPAWQAWVVASGSMRPAIDIGDVVLTVEPRHPLGPNTVITFDHDGRVITHRIVETRFDDAGNPSYVTQGDANRVPDSREVRPDEVLGVGKIAVPYAGLPGWWVTHGSLAAGLAFLGGTAFAAWWSVSPPRLRGVEPAQARVGGRHRARPRLAWLPRTDAGGYMAVLIGLALVVTATGWTVSTATFLAATTNAGNEFTTATWGSPYADAVLADRPIGYWRLGDCGPVATDEVGTVDGTVVGSTACADGLIGDPDGSTHLTGGWIDLGVANAITKNGLAARTVEMWVRADTTTGRQVLYDEGGFARQIGLYLDGGTLHAFARSNGWPKDLHATHPIAAGTTHHLVMVLDVAGDTLDLWVNGSLVATDIATTGGTMNVRAGGVGIGGASGQMAYHDGQGMARNPFGGRIDEVAVYDYALTPARILAHWSLGS